MGAARLILYVMALAVISVVPRRWIRAVPGPVGGSVTSALDGTVAPGGPLSVVTVNYGR